MVSRDIQTLLISLDMLMVFVLEIEFDTLVEFFPLFLFSCHHSDAYVNTSYLRISKMRADLKHFRI